MTVSTTDNRVAYTPNGVQTEFAFNFDVLAESDLKVYFDNVAQLTAFTIDLGNQDVTFSTAPTVNDAGVLTIERVVPLTQGLDLPPFGDFEAEAIEDAFDRATMQSQQVSNDLTTRAVQFSLDEDRVGNTNLIPTPIPNKILGWGASGDLENQDMPVVVQSGTPLATSASITVGGGGDYTTLNDALEFASLYHPQYTATGVNLAVNLLAGFVLAEQILLDAVDLSFVTITGADAETVVTRSALLTAFEGVFPLIGVRNGAKAPRINQLFNMDTSGTGASRTGIYVTGAGSSITLDAGAGVKTAGGDGIVVEKCATALIYNTNFDDANNSGVFARSGAVVEAGLITAQGAGFAGVRAEQGATVNANNCNTTNSGSYGFLLQHGGRIVLSSATWSSGTGTGCTITSGSIATATSFTGTLSKAANALTANGIIFQ